MANRLAKFNILVIDDDRLIKKLVTDVLQKMGFGNVYAANDGVAGFDILEKSPVDFIICDWRMPVMNGLEFVKKLRTLKPPGSLVPVIMLTGNAEAENVLQARDYGINEYLVKPFTVKDLTRRIGEIIEKPREFVMAAGYKGPSRRRRGDTPAGDERRKRNIKPRRSV